MSEINRERFSKYNLMQSGEDSYASQTAQNPNTSRRVLALIPTQAGYIERQNPSPKFSATQLPAACTWLFEFDFNNSGTLEKFFFAADASGGLWLLLAGVWTQQNAGLGFAYNKGGSYTLQRTPVAVKINNTMHLSDGNLSFIFTNDWALDGLPIPLFFPGFELGSLSSPSSINTITRTSGTVTATIPSGSGFAVGNSISVAGVSDTTFNGGFQLLTVNTVGPTTTLTWSQPGFPDSSPGAGGTIDFLSFTVATNRYYWTTWIVQNDPGRNTESSSSQRSTGTGAFTSEMVFVFQQPGTVTSSTSSSVLVGSGTNFVDSMVGMSIYVNGVQIGSVVSVTDPQTIQMGINASANSSGAHFVIAPLRATHWNIYCSEAENSNVGFLLATIPVTTAFYIDQSPFAGTNGSYINTAIERPVRNDPPTGTAIMAVHKNRIFSRTESAPNLFNFTAYEEVLAFANGDPRQCVPGHSADTISDIINEDSYPDQSREIRAMLSFADALFIATESNVTPLFGETIGNFVLSQIYAFSSGVAGPYSMISTPQGLVFMSYDKKLYLWPSQWIPFFAPDESSQLVELSRPLRTIFQTINSADLWNVQVIWYNYGKRNWLVVSFKDSTNAYQTWVFDIETKGWFQLATGMVSVAVFEVSLGNKVLVGGGTDGYTYVLDDQTNTYSLSGLSFPNGIFRPALIDFGDPESKHIPSYLEYEVSNDQMGITVNYYLDPIDADNPGAPIQLVMGKTQIGANRFRGFFPLGSLCERILIEINIASDQINGVFRSINLAARNASKLATP